jgi:hypothetical protein
MAWTNLPSSWQVGGEVSRTWDILEFFHALHGLCASARLCSGTGKGGYLQADKVGNANTCPRGCVVAPDLPLLPKQAPMLPQRLRWLSNRLLVSAVVRSKRSWRPHR